MADSHMMCAIQLYVPNTNKAILAAQFLPLADGQAHVEDEHVKRLLRNLSLLVQWPAVGRICGSEAPCLDSVSIENEI